MATHASPPSNPTLSPSPPQSPISNLQSPSSPLPVAVIGAGPVGLAAAAHLVSRGESPVVFEAGSSVAASVREWGHVRLFSPWAYLVDPAARELLVATGWVAPEDDRLPDGDELVAGYLEPLAALPAIAPTLRLGHRVVAITRQGYDKVRGAGREAAPFELVVETADGRRQQHLARAVIDASGTWRTPNPLGAGGVPAEGEEALRARIAYAVPDALGRDRRRHAGRRTLVVGSGHSAFNAVQALAALAAEEPGTEVVWAIRRSEPGQMFGSAGKDALPARGSLGARLRELVDSGAVRLVTGFRVERLAAKAEGIVAGGGGRELGPFDEIVATTGFRPDLSLGREIRLGLDPWLEAPVRLAPLIDPNLHSCGTVYPHGAEELAHPEKGFFVAGMKSYGRAPTFLLLTGYEQVRSIVAHLVGDEEGARDVRLVLPETGVCRTDLAGDEGAGACCAAPSAEEAAPVAIGGSCGVTTPCSSPASAQATAPGCCG